jgi:hypothetical protein
LLISVLKIYVNNLKIEQFLRISLTVDQSLIILKKENNPVHTD